MGSFYTPTLPYDLNTFLDNLGVYSLTEESSKILDIARELTLSKKYYFLGVPYPVSHDVFFDNRATFSGNITIPALSYLLAISGDSFFSTNQGEEVSDKLTRNNFGFKFRMYDKGGKIDTVINTQFAGNTTNLGVMANLAAPNTQNDVPIGPLFLNTPMVILEPGSLQIEITNLANRPCYIQILLQLCVPINRTSANENIVISGGMRNSVGSHVRTVS